MSVSQRLYELPCLSLYELPCLSLLKEIRKRAGTQCYKHFAPIGALRNKRL
jgi:hypothetical protein